MIQRNGSVRWNTEKWKSVKLNRKKKKVKAKEDNLRYFWDNTKLTNIHIIGVPEREKRDKGTENIFEDIIDKYFINLDKETAIQIQEMDPSLIFTAPSALHSPWQLLDVQETIEK